MNPVLFLEYQSEYKINSDWLKKLEDLVTIILNEHKFADYSLNAVLCDNEFIRELNAKYRHKDTPTDVLSFPTLENIEGEDFELLEKNLGDIVISVDKIKEQALEYEVSEQEEFARLLIHGILHLLGYDHETSPEDEKKMLDLQDKYLERLTSSK